MVDKLSSASNIIAALRAEMSNRTEGVARKSTRRPDAPGEPRRPQDVNDLRVQLAELVKPVALDDPKAVQAVRAKVVRAILLWEFGAKLREHHEWQPMLESITQALEAHPPHQAQFLQLLAELKR